MLELWRSGVGMTGGGSALISHGTSKPRMLCVDSLGSGKILDSDWLMLDDTDLCLIQWQCQLQTE